MKYIITFLFLFCAISNTSSQTKKSIDSLNNISFEIRTAQASSLTKKYLQNVKNSQKINYLKGEADSYSNLGLVHYYQGKYELDVNYSLKAIEIYKKLNNQEKLALEYGELGFRMKKINLQKGIYYMQKGKNISEKNNFQTPLLSIYNNYGYLKELNKENDSALYFYYKGLTIKEKIKDSIGLPYSLNNIAEIYIKQLKYDEAEKLLNRALAIRIKINATTGIAENYFYFGELNFNKKKYPDAIIFYKKSLAIALKNNYLDLVKNCYQMIADCFEKLGNVEESLKNFKKFNIYKDSLINIETNFKIADLEVQFDTLEKEKQIIIQKSDARQKNIFLTGLSILVALIGMIGYLIYRQQKLKNRQQSQEFDLKSAIEKIKSQNKLQEQRLSISRDLHDNIGSQLTFIISSVDNVQYGFDIDNPKLNNKLTHISNFAKDTILELRDTIWAMNSNAISFEDLEIRINNFIEKAKISQENISFSFAIDEQLKTQKLTSIQGMNLYRTIQEAVNNALKYAEADVISINAKKVNQQTKIIISDNGKGFDTDTIIKGNGLRNMQKRIEEIGGTFSLMSSENGTKIEIFVNS